MNSKATKSYLGPCSLLFESTRTGAWRIVRPCVDQAECVLCGICEKYCPVDALTVHKRGSSGTGIEIALDFCKGCGICANVCPKQAMHMISEREAKNV